MLFGIVGDVLNELCFNELNERGEKKITQTERMLMNLKQKQKLKLEICTVGKLLQNDTYNFSFLIISTDLN